jgi:hypothetical protein
MMPAKRRQDGRFQLSRRLLCRIRRSQGRYGALEFPVIVPIESFRHTKHLIALSPLDLPSPPFNLPLRSARPLLTRDRTVPIGTARISAAS